LIAKEHTLTLAVYGMQKSIPQPSTLFAIRAYPYSTPPEMPKSAAIGRATGAVTGTNTPTPTETAPIAKSSLDTAFSAHKNE
jgi:hypothetical protein